MTGKDEEQVLLMDAARSRMDCLYVRGADGAFYLEIKAPEGGHEYVPAEKGLVFKELPNGKYMAVRDIAEYERARDVNSHRDYFDPRKARQRMQRLDKLQQKLERLALDRVEPVGLPHVQTIKDEKMHELLLMYRQAVAAGEEKQCEFQPYSAYAHKLQTRSGKIIRPTLKGEVGMIGPTILVLEKGYGGGAIVQVPRGKD